MQINLNDIENLTVDSVSKLIASKDDSENRQIRVTDDGILFLSDDVGSEHIEGIKFRLETWDAGNDYVGPRAALDHDWVEKVYLAIKTNWEAGRRGYIDSY